MKKTRALLLKAVVALSVGCSKSTPPAPPQDELPSEGHTHTEPLDPFMRVTFPFHDDQLLGDARGGGLLLVPTRKTGRLPLVVFLHGLNWSGAPHLWLTPSSKLPDLSVEAGRLMVLGLTRRFLLAAPSQTQAATTGRSLWTDFDLDEFVAAVESVTPVGVEVDRSNVIVVGHSGAACNPAGGLQRIATQPATVSPVALLAVDPCMDDDAAASLSAFKGLVWVHYQRSDWARPFASFSASLTEQSLRAGTGEPFITEFQPPKTETQPHNAVLVDAFATILPSLLPPHP